MKRRRFAPTLPRLACLLTLAAVLALATSCLAADIQGRLESFRDKTGTPGLVLAVMRQGQSQPQVYVSGLANLEMGTPMREDSIFRVGSVTKVFTAVAVMKLVEDGRLSLDTTMQDYFPQLPSAGAITVRQMLQHSSGLKDFLCLEAFTSDMARPYTPEQMFEMVVQAPLDFPPGSKFKYSNTGYLILGLLVEKVTGQSYSDFLAKQVTGPLGMSVTRLSNDEELVPQRVTGCIVQNIGGKPTPANALWVSIVPPSFAGGLLSRPADFVRLVNLDKVLRPATIAQMREPGIIPGGTGPRFTLQENGPPIAIDYGLGFELVRLGQMQTPLVSKDGSIPGFSSWFVLVPEKGLALAASANSEQAIMPLLILLNDILSDL
jgi:CubicO group peptidase (beta-lactamase class C family)